VCVSVCVCAKFLFLHMCVCVFVFVFVCGLVNPNLQAFFKCQKLEQIFIVAHVVGKFRYLWILGQCLKYILNDSLTHESDLALVSAFL
jgi:hypothetical protein